MQQHSLLIKSHPQLRHAGHLPQSARFCPRLRSPSAALRARVRFAYSTTLTWLGRPCTWTKGSDARANETTEHGECSCRQRPKPCRILLPQRDMGGATQTSRGSVPDHSRGGILRKRQPLSGTCRPAGDPAGRGEHLYGPSFPDHHIPRSETQGFGRDRFGAKRNA